MHGLRQPLQMAAWTGARGRRALPDLHGHPPQPQPVPGADMTDARTGWMRPVSGMIDAAGGRGGFFVALHEYRPALVQAIAGGLGLAFVDFRAERLAPLGWEAAKLPLDDLTREIEVRGRPS